MDVYLPFNCQELKGFAWDFVSYVKYSQLVCLYDVYEVKEVCKDQSRERSVVSIFPAK